MRINVLVTCLNIYRMSLSDDKAPITSAIGKYTVSPKKLVSKETHLLHLCPESNTPLGFRFSTL